MGMSWPRGRECLIALAVMVCTAGLSPARAQAVPEAPLPSSIGQAGPLVGPGVSQSGYLIGPLDTLEINVFGVADLTRTVQVDASGQILYPLIGGFEVASKTPQQVSREIAAKLGERYLQSPQVTVFVKSSMSQRFTVEGAVGNPGIFDLVGDMTLLQAIATAKGVTEQASLRDIVVFRTLDGVRKVSIADLGAIRTGKVPDPKIQPGDLIVVPPANAKSQRWLKQLIGAAPLFYLLGL